ncbi:hypothetical protein KEM55_000048 [Ascosphaera atra]|nr:hypothetical protein KEM55_000048 [Ascosphaera atra]
MACQILLMGITLEKVKIKRSLDKSSGVQEPEDDIIVEIRRASEQLLGGASSRAQTYDDEERGVLRGGTGSGGRRLGSVSSSSSSSDEEAEPEERPQSRPPEQLSLRDMLLSEPTPEERARHESGSRESDPLIPSATSATAATRRSEHPLLRRLERLRRRQSQTPQEPQPFQPISPPYASPGRHPLDTLTHGVESILDFHVFDAIRRQWRHSTRSGFFTAPSVGVPRRTPVGGAPAAPGLSEWGGMVGNGLSNAFTRRPAEEAPRPT